jgi:very-short-patch-repair endonuclease
MNEQAIKLKGVDPVEFARRLRQTRTSSEDWLWQLLRNRQRLGMKFRRQHPLGPYTADFYCHEAKLAVELDGEPHLTPDGRRNDKARDAWMQAKGIEVLRFGGFAAENETKQVLERIDEALLRRCLDLKHPRANQPDSPRPGTPGRGVGGEGINPECV